MLELLLACAPAVDPVTMSAIVKQESAGYPWSIFDNTGKRSYRLASKAEAIMKATELISSGSSIDMGLAQINSKNLAWLGLSIGQVFEPCKNVAAGARVLETGYKKTGSLTAALSMYNTGKPDSPRGLAYAKAVYKHAGAVPAIPGGTLAKLPGLTEKDKPAVPAPEREREPDEPQVSPSSSPFAPRWL